MNDWAPTEWKVDWPPFPMPDPNGVIWVGSDMGWIALYKGKRVRWGWALRKERKLRRRQR